MLAEATKPTDWLQAIMAATSGCSPPLGCMVGEEKRSGKSRFKSRSWLQPGNKKGSTDQTKGSAVVSRTVYACKEKRSGKGWDPDSSMGKGSGKQERSHGQMAAI